jgi:hypothetical protein
VLVEINKGFGKAKLVLHLYQVPWSLNKGITNFFQKKRKEKTLQRFDFIGGNMDFFRRGWDTRDRGKSSMGRTDL